MKKFVLLVFVISALSVKSQQILIPYRAGDKWGFSDTAANTIVKPTFDSVSFFNLIDSASIIGVRDKVSMKYGLINTAGKLIIQPVYTQLEFAPDEDDKAQYYYEMVGDFSKLKSSDSSRLHDSVKKLTAYSALLVKNASGKYGVLDKHGKTTIPFIYDTLEFVWFQNALPVYKTKKNGFWGLLDHKGNVINPFKYYEINREQTFKGNQRVYYIDLVDKESEIGYDQTFTKVLVDNSTLVIMKSEKGYGIKDAVTGKIILEPVYDTVKLPDYSDEYIIAGKKKLFGLFTVKGEESIPFKYKDLSPEFRVDVERNKRATVLRAVNKKNNIGFIKENGQEFIPFLFDSVARLNSENLYKGTFLKLKRDNKWALYHDSVEFVPAIYNDLGAIYFLKDDDPSQYYLTVKVDNKWGIANEKREMIVTPKWNEAPEFSSFHFNDIVITRKGKYSGFYFYKNPERELAPVYEFERYPAKRYSTESGILGFFRVTDDSGKWYYISSKGVVFNKE